MTSDTAVVNDHPTRPGGTNDQLSAENVVPDRLTVTLGRDATALICGDFHLGRRASFASSRIEQDLAERLRRWTGPGAVVLNGDVVELWGEPDNSVAAALDAHPALTAALHAFTREPDRYVVVVVGNHDAAIAWDGVSATVVADRLGGRCTLSLDLIFDTAAGPRVVRCEHGHAFDPANALHDPRNPLDSPLGQHVVQEVLPEITRTPMLADASALTDPNAIGPFLASRLVYRQLGPRAWWLLLPIVLMLALRTPVIVRALSHSVELGHLERWLLVAGIDVVADVLLLIGLVVLGARATYAATAGTRFGPRGMRLNGPPKAVAAALIQEGLAGLITGHTHHPELAAFHGGFYANSGCGTRAVEARPARWFLPPVFAAVLRRSWIEVDVVQDLRVRLLVAQSSAGEETLLERLATRRRRSPPDVPRVVATIPGQAGWPVQQVGLARRARHERVRRIAAVAVGLVALLDLLSAVTPPLRGRLAFLLEVLPIEAPQTAAGVVVFAGVGLFLVAWGLRRGRGVAWAAAVGLLIASAVLHMVKGFDVEEAAAAVLVAAWLVRHRAAFPTRPDRRQLRTAVIALTIGAVAVLGAAFGLVMAAGAHAAPGENARTIAERLVHYRTWPLLPASPLVTPALAALACGILVVFGWLLLRSRVAVRSTVQQHRLDLARARTVVRRYGGDSLAYFALRADKTWFFTGDCVVSYDVRDGVCLVSPDPIGPPEQWADTWAQFMAFTDQHGWPVTVVGASEGWLPLYEAAGLRPVYLGDEAIIDCSRFSLDGRPMKGLRSGFRRVERAGYTTRFYDPANLPPALAGELRDLAMQSRRGTTERGFSMTLSRMFDPEDRGLLLAVAHALDGRADAFCQWVPATDIAGWSLDVMRRRTDAGLPNGLTDFVVIETIHRLQSR